MSFGESFSSTLKTFFHPFYSYTFDDSFTSPISSDGFSISNTQEIYLKRPILAENVFQLYKQDIRVATGPESPKIQAHKKQLQVIHPWTMGRSGHVVFQYHDAPDSQDTKSIFTTLVFLGDKSLLKAQCYRNKYPMATMSIMQMDSYGNLV